MGRKALKTLSVLIVAFLLASFLGACKKDGGSASQSSAGKSSSTAKTSSSTSSGNTTSKSTAATTKTGSSTNSTSSSGGSQGTVENSDQPQRGGDSANDQASAGGGQETGNIPQENIIDYGGKELVVASRNPEPSLGQSDIGDIQYRSWKNAEKKYNFVLKWKQIPGGTGEFAQAFVNEIMAGLHFADVLGLSTKTAFPSLAQNGYIIPVDDYMDFNDPLFNTTYCRTSALWRGKHYGYAGYLAQGSYGIFYNKDIFAQLGLEDLHSVVDSGRWNWDTFVQFAQASTKDFNSDGVIDQWGVVMQSPGHTANALLASNGSAVISEVNGRITFTLEDPKAFKALQFMSDLCNVYKVMTKGNKYQVFSEGTAAMLIGAQYWEGKNFLQQPINYGFVYMPKGPDMQTFAITAMDSNFYGYPATLKNPKEVITIMNDVLTIWDPSKPEHIDREEYLRNMAKLYMRDSIDIEFGVKEFIDPVVNIMPFSFPDATKVVENEVYNKIISMTTTPQAAVESVKQQVQSLIDAAAGQ